MLVLGLLAGCNRDAAALTELDGYWAGDVSLIGGPYAVTAYFSYDKQKELLTGEATVVESPGGTHTYAVRRWNVVKDMTYLQLTDVEDGTRGLDLDGSVTGEYSGDATVRYPCDTGTCGWEGSFNLQSALAPLGTGGTGLPTSPGGTGAPPPPGGTSPPTTPGGTAPPTTPGGTGLR